MYTYFILLGRAPVFSKRSACKCSSESYCSSSDSSLAACLFFSGRLCLTHHHFQLVVESGPWSNMPPSMSTTASVACTLPSHTNAQLVRMGRIPHPQPLLESHPSAMSHENNMYARGKQQKNHACLWTHSYCTCEAE